MKDFIICLDTEPMVIEANSPEDLLLTIITHGFKETEELRQHCATLWEATRDKPGFFQCGPNWVDKVYED